MCVFVTWAMSFVYLSIRRRTFVYPLHWSDYPHMLCGSVKNNLGGLATPDLIF